jgi:threonylcarbamoyladenosine tRNA methylthiotransferase MtaB
MFANTLDLVDACGLAYLHVFPFSPRPGTPAARMPQVARAKVKERAARLRSRGADALSRHLSAQTGRIIDVLAEDNGIGRAEDFCEVALAGPVPPGQLVKARVTGHNGSRLEAEVMQ